ncbi:MAG TPA: hypothetical protein VIY86_13230, partial [Pirellulaceae bacterium]
WPHDEELESLQAFLDQQRREYAANPGSALALSHSPIGPSASESESVELAAWTSVCRVILNLHESITLY